MWLFLNLSTAPPRCNVQTGVHGECLAFTPLIGWLSQTVRIAFI